MFLVGVFTAALFSFTSSVSAATLTLSQNNLSVYPGDIFTVKVVVDTAKQSVNNIEATIKFPIDTLQVVSIDKSSSIISLWMEEPVFSNTDGSINFNGGIANPGYNGSDGVVFSIAFKAKKSGNAGIYFSNAAVRDNDGFGTDVLSSEIYSSVDIKNSTQAVKVSPKTATVETVKNNSNTTAQPNSVTKIPQDVSNQDIKIVPTPSISETATTIQNESGNAVSERTYFLIIVLFCILLAKPVYWLLFERRK